MEGKIPILEVERDLFLFDYKILIFLIIVMIICLIIKRKRTIRMLFFSTLLTTIGYILTRINNAKKFGYIYFVETNSDFGELLTVVFLTSVIFVIIFVVDKIIRKFEGGK